MRTKFKREFTVKKNAYHSNVINNRIKEEIYKCFNFHSINEAFLEEFEKKSREYFEGGESEEDETK